MTKEEYSDTDAAADAADAESLLSHSDHQTSRIKRTSTSHKWATCAGITLLLATNLITGIIAAWAGSVYWPRTSDTSLDRTCSKWTAHESPATEHVDIKYSTVTYNGSFFHQTIFRNDASPEVDAAWEALGVDYRPMRVADEEAEAAGLTKDHVKIRDKYGGGYPANLEGLHHLHCLNLLRQGLHYNYDYYKKVGKGAFSNEEPVVKMHITHCLDIIRQQLMCTVDTGVLGQVWWKPEALEPFVDFNTQHRCKNFDNIRTWAEAGQLPANTPTDYLAPPAGRVYAEIP